MLIIASIVSCLAGRGQGREKVMYDMGGRKCILCLVNSGRKGNNSRQPRKLLTVKRE